MTRRFVLLVFALVALLGSAVAVWATVQERDENLRGYVDASQNGDLPFRVPRLGVNAELTQYPLVELEQQLDLMETAHIHWVRQFVRWDEIEPQRGQFDWQHWDEIVAAFENRSDLQLVVVLVNSPVWTHFDQTSLTTAPPDVSDDYANFVATFAERYGQTVDYYQIWDEPNLTAAWGNREPHSAEYVALLQAAYEAIHSADANATVIAAALAPTTETGPNNISDLLYLRDLYALGAQDYMDAVAAKPYGFDASPDDRTVDVDTLNFSRVVALREEMLRSGDGATPLWASSWGWNSLPDTWAGPPSIWGSISTEQQRDYTQAALDRAEREWPWLAGMILYHWQPDDPPDDPIWGFALIDAQGQSTALYDSLVQRPQPTAATNGLYRMTNPFARYSGVWTFGELGADIGWLETSDSQLEFDFVGADLSLLLREGNYVAYLYPTIDGQPANATPRDVAGNAYVVLTSASLDPEIELIPVARGLTNAPHTLHVVTDKGWDQWAFAGYAVSSSDLAAPYNRQIAVALATVVISTIAVLTTLWGIDSQPLFVPFTVLWRRLSATGQLAISAVTSVALMIGMLLTWGDAVPALFRREPVQLIIAIITAGLLYIEPGFALSLVAALILFVIFYHRLDFGLALIVFWSPFFLFPVQLYSFFFPVAELLLILTAAAWALRGLVNYGKMRQTAVSQIPLPSLRQRIGSLTALDYGVIAWLAVGILSLIWAQYQDFAKTELRVMMLEPVLFYAIFRTAPLDRKALLRIVDSLLLAGFVVAVLGLVLFLRGEAIITAEEGARRLASVYGSPNNVGLFLGRCIPFALAFVLVKTDTLRRATATIILVVMCVAVALSQSVGALFIGVPAAVATVLLLVYGKRAWLPLIGLIGAALVGFALAAQQSERFARVLDFSEGTNFFRLRVWQSALNVIRDHPFTGLGLDQFLYAFRGHYILPDAWQEPDLSHPHNILLDFWVRLGLLGAVVLVWIQIAFWRAAFHAYRKLRDSDPLYFAIIVGAMGSMIDLLAHGLIDNSIYVNDLALVFVLLLALAAVLNRPTTLTQ
ncbi:MAG: O-antigen ligase family protein [Burkholderiales bacterium]|nr:O-antigen ligase family protein [Anaerolineae bacterium]